MKKISNHRELYEYLLFLATELRERKCEALSEALRFAGAQAAGNISTEFLGEARIALNRVLEEENGILSDQERSDLCDVLNQINNAFQRR